MFHVTVAGDGKNQESLSVCIFAYNFDITILVYVF